MVFGNAPKLELASLLQITSVPLETVKSLVCWDLLTGRMELGLRPLLSGEVLFCERALGTCSRAWDPPLAAPGRCDAPLPESKGEVIGARALHLLCLWGSLCPAGALVEKEPHPSVPLFLGAEALQCRRGQRVGERCWQHPFPGGNEPGRRGVGVGGPGKGGLSSWLHLLGGGLPSHWAVLTKSYWMFLNKCFSTCYMPLGKFPQTLNCCF